MIYNCINSRIARLCLVGTISASVESSLGGDVSEDVDREKLMLLLSRDYDLSRDNAALTAPKGSVTVDRTFF